MKKAVIFDVDGLLLNTEFVWQKAWEIVAKEDGCDPFKDLFKKAVGINGVEVEKMLMENLHLDRETIVPLLEHARQVGYTLMEKELTLMPGVQKTLEDLKADGKILALATSTYRKQTEQRLTKTGIYGYFSHSICGDEVTKRKPNPEVYLKSLAKLKVDAKEAIVLEDTSYGVLAAHQAGIDVIMVPSINPPSENDKQMAYAIVKNVLEAKDIIQQL